MTGFAYPNSIAVDKDGLNIYVADRRKKQIVVVPANYAGDIEGHTTRVYNLDANPYAVAVDRQNNVYYSADTLNHDIVKCPPTGGCAVYATGFTAPASMATDKAGNLYVVDTQESKVKKIPAGGGTAVNFGGTWSAPGGVTVDANDNVYVSETILKIIRKIPADGSAPVDFNIGTTNVSPFGITADNSSNLFTSHFAANPVEVRETFADGSGSVIIPFKPHTGGAIDSSNTPQLPKGIVVDGLGRFHLADGIPSMRVQTVRPIGGFFVQPALPSGLTLNRNTGAISGTPTTGSASTTYTITGWNTNGYISTTITLGVAAPVILAPTVSSKSLVFTNTTSNSTTVSWASGNGTNRAVFIAKTAGGVAAPFDNTTYSANTTYAAGMQIGTTGWYCVYNGTGNSVNLVGLAPYSTYRVTVADYNGIDGIQKYITTGLAPASVVTPASADVAPTISSRSLTFSNSTFAATTVNWTSGNGFKRAVFIAQTANGVAAPVNGVDYAANTTFKSGAQVGATGWYCIYNGTGNTANVSGLLPYTTYRVTVVEYNGTATATQYLLTGLAPASVNTLSSPLVAPTVPSLKLTFTNTTAATTTVSWNSGNGAKRAVFVAQTANGVANAVNNTFYNANAAFGTGTQIGATGWYCIYNGTGSTVDVTGLLPNTSYRVTTIEYNGLANAEQYMNTMLNPASVITLPSPTAAPTVPSLKLTFTNTTAAATTVSWNSGNGAKRAVFIAQTANGVANAVNNTLYTGNTAFATGTQIGATGWYCIYNGTGSSVSVTGLLPNTSYRVTTIEYNGAANAERYMNTMLNPASVVTLSSPAVAPNVPSLKLTFTNTTNISTTVSWSSGNGSTRAVFAARTGNGVANAVDNTTYTPNSSVGSGTQIGATGWYCIYVGTGSSANLTGLSASTTYRVTVIEYNGLAGAEKYMNTKLNPASVVTLATGGIGINSLFRSSITTDDVVDDKVVASNLLSPNNDGKNDTWIVKNIEKYPGNSVTVYDATSGVVFSKKNYTNDWAGTYRGGVLAEGTYYYLVDLGNGNTVKGFITVLRNR
jgi:gliding motility-associated-like protein